MSLRKLIATLGNVCCLTFLASLLTATTGSSQEVRVEPRVGKVRVRIDDKLFTDYVYTNCETPYLYPVIGPYSIGMTRNFPMKEDDRGGNRTLYREFRGGH